MCSGQTDRASDLLSERTTEQPIAAFGIEQLLGKDVISQLQAVCTTQAVAKFLPATSLQLAFLDPCVAKKDRDPSMISV